MRKLLRRISIGIGLFLVSLPIVAFALDSRDMLMGFGMPPETANWIYSNLIGVNSSGNIVLPIASGKKVSFTVAGTEKASIDGTNGFAQTGSVTVTSGDVVVPTAAKGFVAGEASRAANVTTATILAAPLYLSMAAAGGDLGALIGSGASASGPTVDFFKTRATSGAATTIVSSGDTIGQIKFFGANGTTYDPAAAIIVKSDATPGATTDMPGSIDLQTSPDGSATLTSALKLDSAQKATFAGKVSLGTGPLYPAALMETVAFAGSVQGNGPLTAGKFIHLCTGADETKVVTLPACASANVGEVHFILNNTTNKFSKVFPNTGDQINSLGANAAYTQGVTGQGGKVLMCACQAATQWYCA